MTNRPVLLSAALLLCAGPGPAAPRPEPVPVRISLDAGSWDVSWNTEAGFIYFLYQSTSLEEDSWACANVLDASPTGVRAIGFPTAGASAPERLFWRIMRVLSLGGPSDEQDTDGDGVSNGNEINILQTDPLEWDSDGDGESDWFTDTDQDTLPDGWELRWFQTLDALKDSSEAPIFATVEAIDMASSGTILVRGTKADGTRTVGLLAAMDILAHKRGTIDAPGDPLADRSNGEYGYETVMMENADSQDNNDGEPDYDTGPNASTTDDDDFVKIVLRYSGPRLPGVSLELIHEGISVDPEKTGAENAIVVKTTPSRINFHKEDGARLNPSSDLKIADLANPGTGWLTGILDPENHGELVLFIEGAELFGFQGSNDGTLPVSEGADVSAVDAEMQKLGGARLKWIFQKGAEHLEIPLLVYRGGFLVFRQPENDPGVEGTFEFWDGKGRIKNERNENEYHQEFMVDDTHWGELQETWHAKSGKTYGGHDYWRSGSNGHTPPGWWWAVDNSPLGGDETQLHSDWITNLGNSRQRWQQSNFCRWKQDDETDPAKRYVDMWVYNGDSLHDRTIGRPDYIEYKFRLFPISPTTRYERSGLLIHPDGKKDGTAGCIGVQSHQECRAVAETLRNYHGLKIRIEEHETGQ